MFRKLFGKKDKKPITEAVKATTTSTQKLNELIEKSTIQILTHQLFMHHRDDKLVDDSNNPAWKNQAIYFWKGDEKFERKSLPPEFKNYPKHYFIVNQIPKEIQLNQGKAIPWFGMEGNGEKFCFNYNGAEMPLAELAKSNIIQYIEMPDLTIENAAVLNDRTKHFWLMNTNMMTYENNNFQLNGKPIPITKAVEIGGLQLIKLGKKEF